MTSKLFKNNIATKIKIRYAIKNRFWFGGKKWVYDSPKKLLGFIFHDSADGIFLLDNVC